MEYKEIKLTTIDKEDLQLLKQLDKEKEAIDLRAVDLQSKIRLYWDYLRVKYSLPYGGNCFIKNNCIYKRELS